MRIAKPIIDQLLAAQKSEQEKRLAANMGEAKSAVSTKPARDRAQSCISLATSLRNALREELHQRVHVFLPTLEMQQTDIPFSIAQSAQHGKKQFIIERYTCQAGQNLSEKENDVRRLARKLASVDPSIFGLLNCRGIMRVMDQQQKQVLSYDFVFRLPESIEALRSLRQDLLSGEMQYSLSKRILVAKELAKSVGYVCTLNYVHKHICPETILLEDQSPRASTFLLGLDSFRAADGGTNVTGDVRWERNLYRHPCRQGEFPEKEYKMQHDIYSLGVCLLEIGLWESFVLYSCDPERNHQQGDLYQQFTIWLVHGLGSIDARQD